MNRSAVPCAVVGEGLEGEGTCWVVQGEGQQSSKGLACLVVQSCFGGERVRVVQEEVLRVCFEDTECKAVRYIVNPLKCS